MSVHKKNQPMDDAADYSKPNLKQVIVSISLPRCHPQTKQKVVQQLTKRQLKQFQSDTLSVYVFTNPPRLSLIAIPKAQDKVYLFADDADIADACAEQFHTEAITRLQTLEPNIDQTHSASKESACRIVSYVLRANAVPEGTPSVVDLMELESRIVAKFDPAVSAVFEPDEYPGLVWIDVSSKDRDEFSDIKTLVFPSGAIVLHGSDLDRMETTLRRKLPLIQKCMRPLPENMKHLIEPKHK